MKKFLITIVFALSLNFSWSCPECDTQKRGGGAMPMNAGETLFSMSLAAAGGEAVLIAAKEDDEDISLLSDVSSLFLEEKSPALERIKKRNLYKKSVGGTSGFEIGDWVDLPAMRVEVCALENGLKNAGGYKLKCYTHSVQGKYENTILAYEIEVVGGYKKSLSDSEFIAADEAGKGSVYVVEAKKTCARDKTVKGFNRVYRYFNKVGEPIDDFWHYERSGAKAKIEKKISRSDGGSIVVYKKIYRKNSVEEISQTKSPEKANSDERILKNGRIRRGADSENALSESKKYVETHSASIKTKLDAFGNARRVQLQSSEFYAGGAADFAKGKLRLKTNADGTVSIYEYHPSLEGDMRTYTTLKGSQLKDISGDGAIGIEDLQNTPVIVEKNEKTDWQGSRHTKRVVKSSAAATYREDAEGGYKVELSEEKIISMKEYEHKVREKGGMVEEIKTYTADSSGNLRLLSTIGMEFETLAMVNPISRYSLRAGTSETGKTIYVPDAGDMYFTASGFLSGSVPNYANAPHFAASGSSYFGDFRITGVESGSDATISLPWGGTHTAQGFALVSGKSTLEVSVELDYTGKPLYEATYVYINGAFYLGEWTYYNYNSSYELLGTYKHNNSYSTQTPIDQNNIISYTDFNGSQYQIGYSDSTASTEIFRRDIGASSAAYGAFTDKITIYAKDVSESGSCGCGEATESLGAKAVSVFSSTQIGGSGTANPNSDELLYQTYEYVLSEDIKSVEVDKYGLCTRRVYFDNNNGTYTLKTITPGFTENAPFSTLVADSDTNDTISLTGLGVVDEYHDLDGDKETYAFEEITYGSGTSARYKYKAYENGNVVGESGLNFEAYYTYDAQGRIISEESNVAKAYTYDAFGNRTETTTRYINAAKTQTATEVSGIEISYEYSNGALWKVITSNSNGDILTRRERLSGFASMAANGNPITEEVITEHGGRRSVSQTSLNRSAKTEYQITNEYAGANFSENTAESTSIIFNGHDVISESKAFSGGNVSQYSKSKNSYDSCGRVYQTEYFSQGGTSLYSYKYFYEPSSVWAFADELGRSKTIKSLGRQSGVSVVKDGLKSGNKYVYIGRGLKNEGLVKEGITGSSFNSNGEVSAGTSVKIAYNDMGLATHYWGGGAIPAMYSYNEFGEITDMYLFKSVPSNAADFTGNSWNSAYTANHADAEHTQWVYDNNGNVVQKIDALGKIYSATYNPYGIMVSYTTPSGTSTSYNVVSDGVITSKTPGAEDPESYAYDTKQRIVSVSQYSKTYSYTYSGDNQMPSVEILPDGFRLERTFDSNKNVSQVVLKDASSNIVYQANYAYNNGRLQTLSANNKTISYSYDASGYISEINLNNVSKIAYTYDAFGRMLSQAYKIGANELKKSLYTVTSDNKISSIENQRNGIAENNWQYEYFANMPGLKNATLNAGSANTQYDAYSREDFEYDLAGNPYRYKSGTTNWNTVSSNKNNQTTQINYASDAVLPIRGKAPADATLNISVDGVLQNYTRPIGQEEFVFGLNAYRSTRKYHEVKAESVETDNNTTPPTTIRTMRRGKAYIEATPENFTYDDDGNMTYDGRWNYSWNSRGRIRDIETSWDAREDGIPYEAYTYTYDWIGRKIQTDYYVHDENWTLVYTNKRYYDDYNLIYETTEYYDGTTPTEVKKYYYGTDLLGSVYGSAGTGGLRMMEIDGETVFALNNQVGSIEALYGADSATAAQARAEYIYSSYGEIMMKSGDLADKNNITYSTRYKEGNTGLVSYTYRHYSPRLKKWINKDPIAEQGGVNLYQMVANYPVVFFDASGRQMIHIYHPPTEGYTSGAGYFSGSSYMLPDTPLSVVNNLKDARQHYRSGEGGTVDAGENVFKEIKNGSGYSNGIEKIKNDLISELKNVDKSQKSGYIYIKNGHFSSYTGTRTVGSVVLFYGITKIPWTALPWELLDDGSCERSVFGAGYIRLSFKDRWALEMTYNPFKEPGGFFLQILTDGIPSIIEPIGKPFDIKGKFEEYVNANIIQVK